MFRLGLPSPMEHLKYRKKGWAVGVSPQIPLVDLTALPHLHFGPSAVRILLIVPPIILHFHLPPPTSLVLTLYVVLYSDRATQVQRNGALACAKWQHAINTQPLTSSLLFDPWHEIRNVGETCRITRVSAAINIAADAILEPSGALFADQWTT